MAALFFVQQRSTHSPHWASQHIQLESTPMFAARPFALNTATAALAGVAVRAITTKTTTIIKG